MPSNDVDLRSYSCTSVHCCLQRWSSTTNHSAERMLFVHTLFSVLNSQPSFDGLEIENFSRIVINESLVYRHKVRFGGRVVIYNRELHFRLMTPTRQEFYGWLCTQPDRRIRHSQITQWMHRLVNHSSFDFMIFSLPTAFATVLNRLVYLLLSPLLFCYLSHSLTNPDVTPTRLLQVIRTNNNKNGPLNKTLVNKS